VASRAGKTLIVFLEPARASGSGQGWRSRLPDPLLSSSGLFVGLQAFEDANRFMPSHLDLSKGKYRPCWSASARISSSGR